MYDASPLIWTMMHPSSTTWNRTYAWNQPLDKYIPWIACQTLSSKPVLLSYTMWNSRQHSDPMAATSTRQPIAMTRDPTPYPDTTNQQKGTAQTNSADRFHKHCCILISNSQPPALRDTGNLDIPSLHIPRIQTQKRWTIPCHATMLQNHQFLVPTSCQGGILP